MILQKGDNIISGLGFTSEQNYRAVREGRSGVELCDSCSRLEPYMASHIDRRLIDEHFGLLADASLYTALEKAMILSAREAVRMAGIDAASPRTLFVVSTTKGNIELLNNMGHFADQRLYLWDTAARVARFFGNPNRPTVVSNACISGVAAQIECARELQCGSFDSVVCVGGDLLSEFIISGFQSFKALSAHHCRPFDAARDGLNLGEAVATIVYVRSESGHAGEVELVTGANHNDANHISGPSRTAEGLYRCLTDILRDVDTNRISFINAHGTATVYNDRMESIAINRAGLEQVPVNALKWHFGHTLGAAGVLETIVSSHALRQRELLPTLGVETPDTENEVNLSRTLSASDRPMFVKMLSGFGGSNAAILLKRI